MPAAFDTPNGPRWFFTNTSHSVPCGPFARLDIAKQVMKDGDHFLDPAQYRLDPALLAAEDRDQPCIVAGLAVDND